MVSSWSSMCPFVRIFVSGIICVNISGFSLNGLFIDILEISFGFVIGQIL